MASTADALYSSACMKLLSNDFEGASVEFALILQSYGDSPGVRHNLALSLECSRNFQGAVLEYQHTIEAFPGFHHAYLGLANCAIYAEDLEHAEGLLKTAATLDDRDPRTLILLSEIMFLTGREPEGIDYHLQALDLVVATGSHPTQSHAHCYLHHGTSAPHFHMFLERSLVCTEAYPSITLNALPSEATATAPCIVLAASSGNAADIARRLAGLPRPRVFLVTLDDLATHILREHAPNAVCTGSYEAHELPAVLLHVAQFVLRSHLALVIPADDGRDDSRKLEWAAAPAVTGDLKVSTFGDLAARPTPSAQDLLDPRRIPPLLRKGDHPDQRTYARVFQPYVQK